jgi:hypothetical protein
MATTPVPMGRPPISINPRNLWSAIRACGWDHWRTTGKWFAYTVGCGFSPIIIGLLLVWGLSSKPVNWFDFVVHGELVIYSASLIAASTRLISKDTETFPFVHREMFILIAILSIVWCVGLYSAIKTAILLSLQNTINNNFIAIFSLVSLVVSLLFASLVFLLDQQRINPNVRGIIRQQEDRLDADFDRLGNQP